LQKQHLYVWIYQLYIKNQAIKYIYSKPLLFCTKLITKSRNLGIHPIDVCVFNPTQFEQLTFVQYFKKYTYDHKVYPTCQKFGKTNLGFIIYENKK
jgi:hypothetical protein